MAWRSSENCYYDVGEDEIGVKNDCLQSCHVRYYY